MRNEIIRIPERNLSIDAEALLKTHGVGPCFPFRMVKFPKEFLAGGGTGAGNAFNMVSREPGGRSF